MKSRKRLTAVVCLLLILTAWPAGAAVSGAASDFALDVKQTILYNHIEAESVLQVYQFGEQNAKRAFDGKCYVVWGEIGSIAEDGKSFSLKGEQGEIACKSEKKIGALSDCGSGERVKVYGKLSVVTADTVFFWAQPGVSMSVDKVEKTAGSQALQTSYSLLDGTTRSSDSMKQRAIGDNAFFYGIPAAWETVEYELPNVEGYQYKLNNLSGKGAAESLFLFYVDSRYLERTGDIGKTSKVQKAIIRNILGNVKIRPTWSWFDSDIRMSFLDADYCDYWGYSGWYTDPNRQNYRVEFFFLPSDGKGLRVLLYVYQTPEHAEDILFLMRMAGN